MFGIGGFELFIILLFGFLIFGPDKLPEMAKTLGAALRKFKQAQAEMESVIKGEVLDIDGNQGKKATSTSSSGAKTKPAPTATQESFAQRKARYDKERAERKAAEEREIIEANRRAVKEQVAKNAHAANAESMTSGTSVNAQIATDAQASATVETDTNTQSKDGSVTSTKTPAQSSQKPMLTPEELFGVKPIQNKPAPKAAQIVSSERGE